MLIFRSACPPRPKSSKALLTGRASRSHCSHCGAAGGAGRAVGAGSVGSVWPARGLEVLGRRGGRFHDLSAAWGAGGVGGGVCGWRKEGVGDSLSLLAGSWKGVLQNCF